jgi:hypothetical protein
MEEMQGGGEGGGDGGGDGGDGGVSGGDGERGFGGASHSSSSTAAVRVKRYLKEHGCSVDQAKALSAPYYHQVDDDGG